MKEKERLNVFVCHVERNEPSVSHSFVAIAYNRGHAAKMIAKQLEAKGIKLFKKCDVIRKLDITQQQAVSIN